jgi:hypothetical protein
MGKVTPKVLRGPTRLSYKPQVSGVGKAWIPKISNLQGVVQETESKDEQVQDYKDAHEAMPALECDRAERGEEQTHIRR